MSVLKTYWLGTYGPDPVKAACKVARNLMAGDPATFKAGYTADNALLAVIEVFELDEAQADEVAGVLGGSALDRVRRKRGERATYGFPKDGLTVNVYKHAGRSFANGGVSDSHDQVILVTEDTENADRLPEIPRVMIVPGSMAGTVKAVVVQPLPGGGWGVDGEGIGPMMGGSYIASSDSRFDEIVEGLLGHAFYGAVPLHDRFETQAQYDSNWP